MRGKAGRAGSRRTGDGGTGSRQTGGGDRRADLFGVVRPGIDLARVVRMCDRGNMAGALRRLDGMIRDTPDSAFLYANKAAVLIEMGRLGEAEDCCRRALDLDGDADHVDEQMGLIMRRSGRPADSLPYHDRVIELCRRAKGAGRDLARAYSNKGAALADMGRPGEAMRCFERSIRADPGYAVAHGNKGALLYQAGRMDDAAECFATARRLDPGFALKLVKE